MDLLIIDPKTWHTIGTVPIVGYSSLIWHDKYYEVSEFELKTENITKFRLLLPVGTLVSTRQSKDIMRVEKHSLVQNQQGVDSLVITGSSLISYLNHRIIGFQENIKYKINYGSRLRAALVILYNSFVNTTQHDLTRTGFVDGVHTYKHSDMDRIPNTVITNSTSTRIADAANSSKSRWLSPGSIYEPVTYLLKEKHFATRIVRPPYTSHVVTVTAPAGAKNGVMSEVLTTSINSMCIDVYGGVTRDITFDLESDELVNFKVDLDISKEKNAVYVFYPQADSNATVKLDRVRYYDPRIVKSGGLSYRPSFTNGGSRDREEESTEEWLEHLAEAASKVLKEATRISTIAAESPTTSSYKYGIHYKLGDILYVRGHYIPRTPLRVTEYILSEDEEGEIGYPIFDTH